ncbi:MAG: PepSY domain-containing protein [Selenomonas massiliensis]
MEMQNVKNKVTGVFTPARLKKAAALAVLVGIVSAGGAYWHHSQTEARSLQEKQARAEMITAQASQRNIALIDEAHVRTIAADAIGKNETELNFRSVYLTVKDHDDRDGKHDKKHKHAGRHDRDRHEMMPPQTAPTGTPADAGANAAPPAQASPMMVEPGFHPVYKVKCYAGNVEYKLRIDAVTGTVLSTKVDVDDDLF